MAFVLPRANFPSQTLPVGDAPIQTLAGKHRGLYLGHVQPRAILWSVVDLQLLSDASDLNRGERLIECGGSMGVEVVHYQHDLLGPWVVQVYKLLYAMRRVDLRSSLGDADVASRPAVRR